MKYRWSSDDKRLFTEQKLRAKTIPPKKFDGPKEDEWDSCDVVNSEHARSQRRPV